MYINVLKVSNTVYGGANPFSALLSYTQFVLWWVTDRAYKENQCNVIPFGNKKCVDQPGNLCILFDD